MLKNHTQNKKLENKEFPGIGRLHELLPYLTRKTLVQLENTKEEYKKNTKKNPINKPSHLKVTLRVSRKGRGWRRGNRGRRSAWNCGRQRT